MLTRRACVSVRLGGRFGGDVISNPQWDRALGAKGSLMLAVHSGVAARNVGN